MTEFLTTYLTGVYYIYPPVLSDSRLICQSYDRKICQIGTEFLGGVI